MEVKGFSKENNFCVLHANSISAERILTKLLFDAYLQKEINTKVQYKYNGATPNAQKITIKTKDFVYQFTDVPTQWDGSFDIDKLKIQGGKN